MKQASGSQPKRTTSHLQNFAKYDYLTGTYQLYLLYKMDYAIIQRRIKESGFKHDKRARHSQQTSTMGSVKAMESTTCGICSVTQTFMLYIFE